MAINPDSNSDSDNKEEVDYKSKYESLITVHQEQRLQIESFRKLISVYSGELLEIATKALGMHYQIEKLLNPT
jgi:hypothetical protein